MIGDHKQLRPKCQHYPLTVESNSGFDLNRSLFERLAIAPGFRLATLGVQHRMHPEISSIPRLVTYNDLADAPKVGSHPHPLGLASRVIFVNHSFHEDEKRVDALESVSKTNAHEREMILKTVQYILKQGYSHDDIVVLTPYLGQMMKLQAELQKCVNVSLDDRDLNEARDQFRGDDNFSKELAAVKGNSSESKAAIRVATIDNYQGEEAKIVLVSLVRSNSAGQIGFLKEPERVNVMLSRARECEIIFGNRATLESAKGSLTPLKGGLLWKTIFSHLEANDQIFDGLPVLCQNHKSRAILSSPSDFDTHCRDGGCTKKCLKECEECGHPCQKYCHPGPCPKCPVLLPDVCSRGHPLEKRCSATSLPKCHQTITWTCPFGHLASGPCHKGKLGIPCKICTDMRVEEEACIKREEELSRELQEKHHRLAEVKRKVEEVKKSSAHRKELEDIEKELALAQMELDEFFAVEPLRSDTVEIANNDISSDVVERNVLTLLQKENQMCLSTFSLLYRDEFGSAFDDDVVKYMPSQRGRKRKLKDVLQCIPCCEIVPSKKRNQFDVQLRDDIDKPRAKSNMLKTTSNETVSNERVECNEVEPAISSDVVERNVLTLLQKEKHVCLSNFSLRYRNEFGSAFDDDVAKYMPAQRGRKRKLKDVLQCIPCCEIVPSKKRNQFDVQLRDDIDKPERKSNMLKTTSNETLSNERVECNEVESIAVISDERLQKRNETTSDSISSSILPPMPSVDDTLADYGDAVSKVLLRYNAEGALKADDLLDEITVKSHSIDALRFIIELELNPGGTSSSPPYSQASDNISNILLLTARALDLSAKFPLQARDFAKKALSFVTDEAVKNCYPKNWIPKLEKICEQNSKPLQDRAKPSNTVKEAWVEVKSKDPNAPGVMSDAILPLIGLEAVKESLLGMYYRFKLAQEQGDGAAASYNVRFEGNPGYVCIVLDLCCPLQSTVRKAHLYFSSRFAGLGRLQLHVTMVCFYSSC